MKKFPAVLLAAVLALALTACGPSAAAGGAGSAASSAAPSAPDAPVSGSAAPASSAAADASACTVNYPIPDGMERVGADSLPAGVTEMYQAQDGSNVNLVLTENDGTLPDTTQDMLQSALEQAFSQQAGSDVKLENVQFTAGTVGACAAYRFDYTVPVNGVTLSQSVIGIAGSKVYTISYTDTTGGTWHDAFEQSISGIRAVPAA